jgi:hypothetical protein
MKRLIVLSSLLIATIVSSCTVRDSDAGDGEAGDGGTAGTAGATSGGSGTGGSKAGGSGTGGSGVAGSALGGEGGAELGAGGVPEDPGAGGASESGAAGEAGAGGVGSELVPNFILPAWTLYDSVDTAGTPWNGSTLTFTIQTEIPAGYALEGKFQWISNGTSRGVELVRGDYDAATRRVSLAGYELENPSNIVLSTYTATYDEPTDSIVDGSWTGSNVVPGTWKAQRTKSP